MKSKLRQIVGLIFALTSTSYANEVYVGKFKLNLYYSSHATTGKKEVLRTTGEVTTRSYSSSCEVTIRDLTFDCMDEKTLKFPDPESPLTPYPERTTLHVSQQNLKMLLSKAVAPNHLAALTLDGLKSDQPEDKIVTPFFIVTYDYGLDFVFGRLSRPRYIYSQSYINFSTPDHSEMFTFEFSPISWRQPFF